MWWRIPTWISGTLEKVHDVEFDETKGSQEDNENLEDVRGIQLLNAMKNMDIGELRHRQVNDDEDDQVQLLSNSNVQDDTNQASTNGSHDNKQNQLARHHLNQMIKQVQAIKFQCSNQPIL